MEARVDDTVHIEIKIVVLKTIRVRLWGVNWNGDVIDDDRLLLHYVHYHQWILFRQPPVKGRNAHISPSSLEVKTEKEKGGVKMK